MRELIQEKLEEIQNIETTSEVPDNILEKGKTYFSFNIQQDYQGMDCNSNYTYTVLLIGFIKRIDNASENTLDIIDKAKTDIKDKLKEINYKSSFQDVSIENGIRKIKCTANAKYNELTNVIY